MSEELSRYLHELEDDVGGLLQDRKDFSDRHAQLFLTRYPQSEACNEQMWRFRNYAGEVIRRWKPGADPLDSLLQFAVVDAHDAAIDAYASIVSGAGAPGLALFRRFYELAILLSAGWQNPQGLRLEMEKALNNTRLDDHYAGLAKRGVIGAVMPASGRVRRLAFEDPPGVQEFERGLQSIGHGGLLSGVFYLQPTDLPPKPPAESRLAHSLQFAPFIEALIGATVGASWQILERMGYPAAYRGADARFQFSVVDAAEDRAIAEFDRAFPNAFEVVWSTLLGLSSISIEVSEATGPRGYDPIRRRTQLMHDCFETGCLAMEFLFRGRLGGAATLIRRLFELSLELHTWVRFEGEMTKRFADPASRERTPSATSLIAKLHGPRDAANQRRTYSTLCSVAHGGFQSHEYLLAGDWKTGFKIQPAPAFVYRHHRWLLGTLVSALDASLGGALLIADGIDRSIARAHGGYLQLLRQYIKESPELTLLRHEEVEWPPNDAGTRDAG